MQACILAYNVSHISAKTVLIVWEFNEYFPWIITLWAGLCLPSSFHQAFVKQVGAYANVFQLDLFIQY